MVSAGALRAVERPPSTTRRRSRIIAGMRKVMPTLVEAGCRVVAPDYRGAGHSSRPADGYDKRTMAGDVQRLLRQHLDVSGQVILVGHDIGLMVAYAYARAYRDEVSHLAVVDAPLPGTTVFDRLRTDPRVWHFAFHAARCRRDAGRWTGATVPAGVFRRSHLQSVRDWSG